MICHVFWSSSIWHGDKFQYVQHDKYYELIRDNPSNLSLYCNLQDFHPIYPTVEAKTNDPLRLHLYLNRTLIDFTGLDHYLMPGSGLTKIFLVLGNTEMIQYMLGNCYPDYVLVSQSTHWSLFWVGHNSLQFKYFSSPLQSESTVNSSTHKYLLEFPMERLTATASPTNLCLECSSGDTVDLDMK